MDWTSIITATITACFTLAGTALMYRNKRKEDAVKDAVREQKQSDRLESIEHKLDIHNGYAEKLGAISESIVGIKKDIEYLRKK